jgi:dTDP-4-amino-4,6-dideoxygalactose transaminase
LVEQYRKGLSDLAPAVVPLRQVPICCPAWHLFVVLIDFDAVGISRGALMRMLKAKGIGSQVHYIPLYRQPYYRHRYGQIRLPGAEAYYSRCLSLPLFTDMTEQDVDRVVTALRGIIS